MYRRRSGQRTHDRGGDGERQGEQDPSGCREDDKCLGGLQGDGPASRQGRHQWQHLPNQASDVHYKGGRGLCPVRFQTRFGEKWSLSIE